MKQKANLSVVLLLLISFGTIAQDSTIQKFKPQFKLGVYYNSGLNYYGRTDSLRSSGFFPVAEVWLSKHFYITAAPVFTYNKSDGFDYAGSVATAGFRFNKEKEYVASLYAVVPVYEDYSNLVQSSLKAQGAASYTWLNKIMNITGGADIKISDKIDYGVMGAVDHLFRYEMKSRNVLVINPTATINAGTQRFNSISYKRTGFLLLPGPQQAVLEQEERFSILSYEFSMPVVYAIDKLQLIANPAYVLPRNIVSVPGRPDLSERGQDMFYATVGVKYNF